jgi:hypothetical protein
VSGLVTTLAFPIVPFPVCCVCILPNSFSLVVLQLKTIVGDWQPLNAKNQKAFLSIIAHWRLLLTSQDDARGSEVYRKMCDEVVLPKIRAAIT